MPKPQKRQHKWSGDEITDVYMRLCSVCQKLALPQPHSLEQTQEFLRPFLASYAFPALKGWSIFLFPAAAGIHNAAATNTSLSTCAFWVGNLLLRWCGCCCSLLNFFCLFPALNLVILVSKQRCSSNRARERKDVPCLLQR